MLSYLSKRAVLWLFAVALVVVAHPSVWALKLHKPTFYPDSFPLSTFPMFSAKVPEKPRINHVIATGPEGLEVRVPYWLWTTGGMNTARAQLNQAVRKKDKARLTAFCQKAARAIEKRRARAAARGQKDRFDGATRVRIVRSRYHLERYFRDGQREPVGRRRIRQCKINDPEPEPAPAPTSEATP